MKLLLDEMHVPGVAAALPGSFDVMAVAAEPELRGRMDEELLEFAVSDGRGLVTENVVDFLALAARWADDGRRHAGLIFTHPRKFNRASLAYPGNLITALRRFLDGPAPAGDSWICWL